jgi:GNAT superfamily N-acetyltransferase
MNRRKGAIMPDEMSVAVDAASGATCGGVVGFLPGRLLMGRGTARDYAALARFHYRGARPATWAGVWVVRYVEERHGGILRLRSGQAPARRHEEEGRVVAVAVLSNPTVNSHARDAVLKLAGLEPGRKIAWINKNVRAISRVIVHPQFRALGLASRLVERVCRDCPTRFVEAFAVMGRVHPFFEKGGMSRFESGDGEGPVYYWLDRGWGVVRRARRGAWCDEPHPTRKRRR